MKTTRPQIKYRNYCLWGH